MPALDAMHLKVLLRDDLQSGKMHGLMQAFIDSWEGRNHKAAVSKFPSIQKGVTGEEMYNGPTPISHPGAFRSGLTGVSLCENMVRMLDVGEAFYVDPVMHPLVTAASESMPDETFMIGDAPSEYGFLVIPGGLGIIDVRGRPIKMNAVMWSRNGPGLDIFWFTDKHDPEDGPNMELRKNKKLFAALPRYTLSHAGWLGFDRELPKAVAPDFIVPPEMQLDVNEVRTPDGGYAYTWTFPEGYGPEELQERMGNFEPRTDAASRWLLTVWRLMQQSITSLITEEPTRQMRRQFERKNLPEQKITVIALRRNAAQGDGTTEVEWTHRWLVRGHWRKQPCKDEHGEWTTRLVYIHPYIKGPEDKPLLVRDHVYALVR